MKKIEKFYTKSQKKEATGNSASFLDFVSKETKNQIAWEMINNGADVNEVFQKIGFSLDDHVQLNKLKDMPSNQPNIGTKVYPTSDKVPEAPIPPAMRYVSY